MAVVHVLKNWFWKLDEVWVWISSSLLPAFNLGPNDKQIVLNWVANYVTQPPTDLADCWRDGILLCELADKFSPELFHGLGILDPKNCFHNVSLALEIIKGRFEIDPDVNPEDIVTCVPEAEAKLLDLLLKLKQKVESKEAEEVSSSNDPNSADEEPPEDSTDNDCFAQGTGLVIGFLGRKASFIVYSNGSPSEPDLVVEIKGPEGTHCCERVTERSPKRKSALPPAGTPRPRISHCGRSQSQTDLWAVDSTSKKDPKIIPLEYEIKDDLLSVGYVPLKTGPHTITLLWHGRYVTGCPFVAAIEDSFDVRGNKSTAPVRPPILRKETPQTTPGSKKPSVRFKEPDINKVKLGKVRCRRVLRYIIKIGMKDVIVEADSSEMLAPALQKLDLPNEGIVLGPRRNSWGFVGDIHSQRRLSLMRQLCIDNNDEDQDQGRQQKRSSSINVPLTADPKGDGITNEPFTISCTHPLVSSSRNRSDLTDDEHAKRNISALQDEDFNKERNSTQQKFARLETVCEGEVQLSPFTSSRSAETDDKVSSSEDEVFYRRGNASISESTYSVHLTEQNEIPRKDRAENLCKENVSDPYQEHRTDQLDELVTSSISEKRDAPNENMPQGYSTSSNISLETHSGSAETEKEALSEKQVEKDANENILCGEIIRECQVHSRQKEFFNSSVTKGTDLLCAQDEAEKFHPKKENVVDDSKNHVSSSTNFAGPAESKLEPCGCLDTQPIILRDKMEAVSDLSSVNREMCSCSTSTTPNEALVRTGDEDIDPNQAANEIKEYSLSEDYSRSQLRDDMEKSIAESDATVRKEENLAHEPEYCSACNCESVSTKQSINEKCISSGDWNITEDITLFNVPNMKLNEDPHVLYPHSESGDNHSHNFLQKAQPNNSQGHQDGRMMKSFQNESGNMIHSERYEDNSFLFLNHQDMSSVTKLNDALVGSSNYNKWNESSSNEKERMLHNSENRSESKSVIETRECFPESTNSSKTDSTLKCSKHRRILSHPYLKSTYYRTVNSDLSRFSHLFGTRGTSDLEPENPSDRESCHSRTRRHSDDNSSFKNMVENNIGSRECSFFKWPESFSNADRKSVLNSEYTESYRPKSNEYYPEKDNKLKEILKIKPVTGESLKFSLQSYKDKHRSADDEEFVPSNSVKDIVKDFHSKSLEYPAPRSDRANDIYLRRTFFPPLAANEGRKNVKNHISKWEKSQSTPETESLHLGPNKSAVRDKLSLYVSVQSKVAFWESAYHAPEGDEVLEGQPSANSSALGVKRVVALEDVPLEMKQQDYSGFESTRDSDNAVPWKPQPHRLSTSRPVTSEQTEDSGISDDLLMCLKTSDHKRPPVFSRPRSLSDPCIRTSSTIPTDFLSNFEENLNIIPSTLYCSSEENSEEASSESEDANDEYIDDEIPDYAAMFLGDYISFTGLLGPERSSLRKDAVTQYLQKLEDKSRHIFDPSLSRPHECRALGVGVHYGLVSMNNHFQVLTKDAGRGNLSVSIQGSGRHDVTKIIVTYCRNDVYDVIYQVLEPGYYIISIRWSDWSIPGSPFICKVTY